ncbi:MAG TPA: bifunctional nuclease domain-containing protein [Planctomycetota bacterium]|nr:bifunctional nuclease domain-containing protein [Planctomycetota bacterium]
MDSRPSDAIAVAVLMKVPIYVEERVLEDVVTDPAAEPPDLTLDEDEEE